MKFNFIIIRDRQTDRQTERERGGGGKGEKGERERFIIFVCERFNIYIAII